MPEHQHTRTTGGIAGETPVPSSSIAPGDERPDVTARRRPIARIALLALLVTIVGMTTVVAPTAEAEARHPGAHAFCFSTGTFGVSPAIEAPYRALVLYRWENGTWRHVTTVVASRYHSAFVRNLQGSQDRYYRAFVFDGYPGRGWFPVTPVQHYTDYFGGGTSAGSYSHCTMPRR